MAKPPRPASVMRRAGAETIIVNAIHDAADAARTVPVYAFDKGVYGTKAVKRHLKQAQHGKCCYCETWFAASSAGTVEHYRPKGRVADAADPERSGYYWLAYDWANLYFACSICNESHKGSRFPLADETLRARSHRDDVGNEDPLVLDPGGPRDPRDHIRFRADVPRGVSQAGVRTIEVTGLDREALCIARRKHLTFIGTLLRLREVLDRSSDPADIDEKDEVDRVLAEYRSPSAQYLAATSDFLQSNAARA